MRKDPDRSGRFSEWDVAITLLSRTRATAMPDARCHLLCEPRRETVRVRSGAKRDDRTPRRCGTMPCGRPSPCLTFSDSMTGGTGRRCATHAAPPAVVRAAQNVSVESIGSDDHFILVLRNPAPGAVIRLRPAAPLRTVLVDALTGDTLRAEQYDGRQEGLIAIDLPDRFKILLFAAQAASPR